jgi:hypothetical protein
MDDIINYEQKTPQEAKDHPVCYWAALDSMNRVVSLEVHL